MSRELGCCIGWENTHAATFAFGDRVAGAPLQGLGRGVRVRGSGRGERRSKRGAKRVLVRRLHSKRIRKVARQVRGGNLPVTENPEYVHGAAARDGIQDGHGLCDVVLLRHPGTPASVWYYVACGMRPRAYSCRGLARSGTFVS